MAQCAACGNDNLPDAHFCGKCGKPLDADAAPAGGVPVVPIRRYRQLGPVLGTLVVAVVIGYFLGIRATRGPASERAGAAAPAKVATTTGKPSHTKAGESAAPTGLTVSDDRRWARMQAETAACGKFNIFCQEKVRWHYCKGYWGKVPECSQASTK
jgi:zinc-ribbon domain